MDDLVTTAWLAAELGADDLVLLDATYDAFDDPAAARAAYDAGHIPGARFMDLGGFADPHSPLPGMLPPAGQYRERMRALGVGDGARVVLYDGSPHHTSARAWWMLRVFELTNVAILDGGLAKWIAEVRPLSRDDVPAGAAELSPRKDEGLVRSLDQVQAAAADHSAQIVDARGPARFAGIEPDPRPGVAPGHIPGSRNLPYTELFQTDGTWKRDGALRAAFDDAGVSLDRPLLFTCGSGVTAAVLLFGAHLLGAREVSLYDGSWSEWGAHPDTPKALA